MPLDQGALHYVPWVSGSSQQDVMAGQNATRILPSCLLSTPLNREREVKGNLKNVEHNRRNDWSSRNLTLLPRSHIIIENPLNLKGLGVYSMQQWLFVALNDAVLTEVNLKLKKILIKYHLIKS